MQVGRARCGVVGISLVAMLVGMVATQALAAPNARLNVVTVSAPPATAEFGDEFTVTGEIENLGNKASKGRVTASLKETADPGPGPIVLGTSVTGKVLAHEQGPFSIPATVPELAITEDTAYNLVVCVRRADNTGRTRCLQGPSQVTVSPPDEPVFTPGARTLGDELFPQTGNGGYDVGHYKIELDYDPGDNEFLAGTKTTINALATQNLSEFSLDFQDIPVSAVTVNDEPADGFTQVDAEPVLSDDPEVTQPMKLVIDPATNILEGEPMEVVVEYAGTPVLVVDVDTSWEGWIPACYPLAEPQTCDGAFVVNEPNGAQGWFPSNNFPTDKATYETSITVPEDYEAAGIGELVSNQEFNGKRTWVWAEDDPTSTYLTTATVGDFIFTQRDITETLTGRLLPQFEFIDRSSTEAEVTTINTALGRTEAMTNWLSERFGPYPYDSGGAVADKAAGVGYALEVATKSHYAGNSTTGAPNISQSTLVHEISHQWMGNAVTLKNWTDIWFQEGWAQWVSWSWNFTDGTSPTSPAGQWQTNYASGFPGTTKWDVIPTELGGDPENLFSTFPTYTRGAMTYEGYRQIVGANKFFEFARELPSRFAYDNVSSEEVVDLAIEISDFDGADLTLLEGYFNQWLYQAGRPTITADDFT